MQIVGIKSKVNLTDIFLFLSVFTLQFYIIESGKPQLSHVLLAIFSLLVISKMRLKMQYLYELRALKRFTLYAVCINLLFFISSFDLSFIISSIFCVYNFVISFALLVYLRYRPYHFKDSISCPILLSMILLVVFYFVGLGRFYFYPRYNGFFNDPNQMAFWALCSMGVINIKSNNIRLILVTYLLCVVICVVSVSRSALIGLSVMSLGVFIKIYDYLRRNPGVIIILILILFVGAYQASSLIDFSDVKSIEYLIDRASETDVADQLETRGYDLIAKYPEYLFFGAGQGGMDRFNKDGEVHSTWAGILFYYGIVGLSFFIYFLYMIIKRLRMVDRLIFLGPLLYGFSTFGARTPVFYFFLISILAFQDSSWRLKNINIQ